jgi:hypothetical protein
MANTSACFWKVKDGVEIQGEAVGVSVAPAASRVTRSMAAIAPPSSGNNRFNVSIKANLTIGQIISLI